MNNVLVIDDDHYNRENIRLNLIPSNNNIDCVNTAAEGLECLKKHNYDLIILDATLPDQSGLGFAREMHDMGKSSRFILMSDWICNNMIKQVEELKIDKLVQKPYDEPQLYRLINQMLSEG